MNVHGGKKEYGVNYLDTYSPIVNWFSIRTLLAMAAIDKWHSIQVDFIEAYPQAPINYDPYIELLKGFKTKEGNRTTHVLQIIKNMYGKNQAG